MISRVNNALETTHAPLTREINNRIDLLLSQSCTLREIALALFATVPSTGTEQLANFIGGKFVELVDRAQHREPASRVFLAAKVNRLHHSVDPLAVVHL